MGSEGLDALDDEKPEQTIFLDSFWIYQTPVTNEMFEKFVDATGYITTSETFGESFIYSPDGKIESLEGASWKNPEGLQSTILGYDDYPVVHISWIDASAYCEWVGGRLPTEAEWEKAARGPYGHKFPWGDMENFGGKANYCDSSCEFEWAENNFNDGFPKTSPVGTYTSGLSYYGVLDMAGNVWEWCSDWYDHEYYQYSPKENPKGPEDGDYKVMRGGSYLSGSAFLRSSLRDAIPPYASTASSGFRCVVNP